MLSKRKQRRCIMILRLIAVMLLIGFTAKPQWAQTSTITDGSTPTGAAPGAPVESDVLSKLESVNLFNGHVSFNVPIKTVDGRGEAQSFVTLGIDTSWRVRVKTHRTTGGQITYEYQADVNPWSPLTPGYGPGVVVGRRAGLANSDVSCGDESNRWSPYTASLTRLTFILPNGSEYELRDQLPGANGRPLSPPFPSTCFPSNTTPPATSRGTTFASADGSAATFISDTNIYDAPDTRGIVPYASVFGATGYLMLRDGSRSRVEDGLIKWTRDRNGNLLTFAYGTSSGPSLNKVIEIKDSLNRTISIAYDYPDVAPYGLCDRITFKGFSGADRIARVSKSNLHDALRPGYSVQAVNQLFPGVDQTYTVDPVVASSLWLPNGQRYRFYYNSYVELARVELPSGGAAEYDYGGLGEAGNSGFFFTTPEEGNSVIYRRLIERRVAASGTSWERKTTYDDAYETGNYPPDANSSVTVNNRAPNGTVIGSQVHYFHGSALGSMASKKSIDHSPWQEGREYRSELFSGEAGTTRLRRIDRVWAQRAPLTWWRNDYPNLPLEREPANDPRLVEITTTFDTNLVTKKTFGYDQYNNQTDVSEYDFGTGSPGGLIRRTHTDYVTINPVNNQDYTGSNIHLRALPEKVSVFDVNDRERARTRFEYDNYASVDNHHNLVNCPGISGLDPSFDIFRTTRGNVTATTSYFFDTNGQETGSIASYMQYDIAGNVIKTIDGKGNFTLFDFTDRFGSPDANAQANSAPYELSSQGQSSYAFPSSSTNSLGQTAYLQVDYYLGETVDAEDLVGTATSALYEDALDRKTEVILANNRGTNFRSHRTFHYDHVNRVITTTGDLDFYNDRVLKSQTLYDGLDRAVEQRDYVGGSQYIAVRTIPFVVLQDGATWRVASQRSNPFRENGTPGDWSTTFVDALNRVVSSSTSDGAKFQTSYTGNTVTVTDAAGKKRKSISDPLGRIKEVHEGPTATAFVTNYGYDALDNLMSVSQYDSVSQHTQMRNFTYDSLNRLTSASNPENGTASFQYDGNGNLSVRSDARGVSAHYDYDSLNRVIRRWYNGSSSPANTVHNEPALPAAVATTDEVKYFYDNQQLPLNAPAPPEFERGFATGRLVGVTYGGGNTGTYYGYDELGRIDPKIQRTGGINYKVDPTYNLAGAVTHAMYPSGHSVNYAYGSSSRLNSFSGNLGNGVGRTYASSLEFTEWHTLQQEEFGTDIPIFHKRRYNIRGQVWSIGAGTVSFESDPDYVDRGAIVNYYSSINSEAGQSGSDNNGNLRKQEIFNLAFSGSTFGQTFSYDSLNRLSSVEERAPIDGQYLTRFKQSYLYDRWGNRRINRAETETFGVNNSEFVVEAATNRLYSPGDLGLAEGARRMQYDAVGNLKRDTYRGQGDRSYDAENRMKQIATGAQSQTYTYDGEGRRVGGTANNLEVWQVYGLDGALIAEYPINGSPANPTKEYGYRNGQLLVVAEVGTASGAAPSALSATPSTNGTSVGFNWTAADGATNYRIERQGADEQFASVGTSTGTSFTDNNAVNGSAYLYKVCAANGAGVCVSGFSNIVLGARFNFPTDPTITSAAEDPTGATVTSMKVEHITELRAAVNAVRDLAGMPLATWARPTLTRYVTEISKTDVEELRERLNEALGTLGVQTSTYEDPILYGAPNGTLIRAAHIRQLRERSTRGVGGAGGGGGGSAFTIRWLIADHLGTPRMIFDQTGSIAGQTLRDYLPFGEELVTASGRGPQNGYKNGDTVRQKFTSQERDGDTGLDYFGARYYASVAGRFTSPDAPFADQDETDPQSWNMYSYVRNRPLMYVDPSGRVRVRSDDGDDITLEMEQGDDLPKLAAFLGVPLATLKQAFPWAVGMKFKVGMQWAFSKQYLHSLGATIPSNWVGGGPSDPNTANESRSSVAVLLSQFLTGIGPRERRMGPDSYMTQQLKTSPDVAVARQRFLQCSEKCVRDANGLRRYGPTSNGYYATGAQDSPWRSGRNMPRQFVGGFTITIQERQDRTALFTITNETGVESASYHVLPNAPWRRGPVSTTHQTYWWIEKVP